MITFYNAQNDMESRILEAVLKLKNVEYTTERVVSEAALSDRDFLIPDVLTAIRYLDEKFPSPKLFPGQPEQVARLNLFATKVFNALETGYFQNLLKELAEFTPPENFITGDFITIADLLLVQFIQNKEQWTKYKNKVMNYNLQKA